MKLELTREYISELRAIIEARYDKAALAMMADLHPADIAEIYEELSIEEAKYLYMILDPAIASDVLVELEEDDRERFLKALPAEEIASQFINNMDSDDAADVIADLDDIVKQEVLKHITDIEQAGDIVDLLSYDENSAGGLMAKELIKVNENWTLTTCLREMRKQAEEVDDLFYIYVVNDDNVLIGVVSLKAMLIATGSTQIKEIYNKEVRFVRTDTPSEEVAQIMEKYDLVALPVVDSIGRLLGRITIDDIVDVIRDEAEKDYQMASGISSDVETTDSPLRLSRARLPWLIIGLVGGILVAALISQFEADIKLNPEMAFFIPLIAAMAGNVGIQSSAIIVQGLRQQGMALTYTVSISLFVVIIFAAIFGTLIPLVLNKMKLDPALATGPFITTTNDIMGLFIYFLMGRILYDVFTVM